MHDPLLLKTLIYMLSYHPDEFGLIPDNNEFFKIKEIFQALNFTKKFKKLNLNILKQLFSYYYRDFFEFSEPLNLVKPKEKKFTPPFKISLTQVYNFKKLWTFVKPRLWYKLCLDEKWSPREGLFPVFTEKELAENWAKAKGALLIEVLPYKFFEDLEIYQFGEKVLLLSYLHYTFLKGPPIDQKFIRKYLPQEKPAERPAPILPFNQSGFTEDIYQSDQDLPFRKLTRGKKKEKPWKKYQKKKARLREELE
jgi:putative RNA 2'-phosphotransferase